ncbi:MAG: LptA/OstA family protein [Pseudomonadota bacterium]|nr:LptA/OstA family protein [Pseudomonadota bacterium]|tara:strand:+ start:198 stop:617 length:420 start_codon:yes stop_codon:yes gene_type:complete
MYKKIKFFNALLIIFLSANLIADENYFYDNIIINSDVVEASRTKILFKGNVRITSNEMNIEGNQATFLTEESALIILGTPTNIKIFENDKVFTGSANRIEFTDSENLNLIGDVSIESENRTINGDQIKINLNEKLLSKQ